MVFVVSTMLRRLLRCALTRISTTETESKPLSSVHTIERKLNDTTAAMRRANFVCMCVYAIDRNSTNTVPVTCEKIVLPNRSYVTPPGQGVMRGEEGGAGASLSTTKPDSPNGGSSDEDDYMTEDEEAPPSLTHRGSDPEALSVSSSRCVSTKTLPSFVLLCLSIYGPCHETIRPIYKHAPL